MPDNGQIYWFIFMFKYIGILSVWMALIFGGAGIGVIFHRSVGGVAIGLGIMAFGTIILFKWMAKL